MIKIIIWGATGQAVVLEELLSTESTKIEAFFENDTNVRSSFEGIPIYYGKKGFTKWLSTIENISEYYYLVAIGGDKGRSRFKIGEMLKTVGLKPYTAIHRTAFIAYNARIGEGSQIMANCNVCAKVIIGKNCIVNTAASIDHESIIGNNVHIGPGAKLAGCVLVGDNSFIGTNATILPRIKIGESSIIGAGAVVTKDVQSNTIVIGNPAKPYY